MRQKIGVSAQRVLAILASVVLLTTLASVSTNVAQSQRDSAAAADMSGFNPGNIIDDSRFFNGNVMSASDVQSFLNSKESGCQSGYTCLNSYTESTPTIAANPMCAQYNGAANESAATIIAKVGAACGISQKVILVTLQKEQGLVTSTGPSSSMYLHAMGALCPDSAPCDSAAAGFFNQVYTGAYLFMRYTQPAGTGPGTAYYSQYNLSYPVGQTSNVLYNPNSACGSLAVNIQNQATHVLYVYTPYTPNAAALASSYGVGDGCSSYGNRNFYSYFMDWFGSVRGLDYAVGQYFTSYYANNSSWLGYTTGPMTCGSPNGGCFQSFQNGMVFSSQNSYAAGVRTAFVSAWSNYGREFGILGYPTADQVCDLSNGGCRQTFQGGTIVAAPSGNRVVPTNYMSTWGNWGREWGALGWPTSDQVCTSTLCFMTFNNAWVISNPSVGTRVVPTAVLSTWSNWGRELGTLGLPTGDPSVPGGSNYTQAFQGGTITVTNNIGAVTATVDPWYNAIVTSPWLGGATGNKSCDMGSGGCRQGFTNGWIVQSASGTFAVPNAVYNTWGNWGREYGILGLPSGAPSATPSNSGSYTQAFQGGTITVTNGFGALTSTTNAWFNTVLTQSWLGGATGNKSCDMGSGGCRQAFTNGWIVQSASGTFAVPNAVYNTWGNWGREYGILGLPSGAPSATPSNSGSYTQAFQGGTITVTNGFGALTSTTNAWFNTVLTQSWLGGATGNKSCDMGSGGCRQAFTNGWIVQSASGTFAVPNAVYNTWGNWGREYGILGLPSGAPSATPSNSGSYTQAFQGGTITVTNGFGALTSTTNAWFNTVLTQSWLGGATGNKSCDMGSGGCRQAFTNGWIVQSASGTFAVPNAVYNTWGNWGREYGILGLPSGAPSATPSNSGSYTQAFQGGTITVTNGFGALTSTTNAWFNTVLTQSWLGGATGNKSCDMGSGGCRQGFTNGWIVQSASGTFAVPNAVYNTWGNWGREYGILGLPSGAPSATPSNSGSYTQAFQGGTITVTNGFGALTSTTNAWFNTVLTQSWLGGATGNKSCDMGSGGCRQAFTNGWIVQSASGTFAVPNAVYNTWGNWGREYDVLGFPTGNPSATPSNSGSYTQAFQGGVITITNGFGARTS